jgi:peptidyl-prolyl cis-trans isomerase B (cyclophilin B)
MMLKKSILILACLGCLLTAYAQKNKIEIMTDSGRIVIMLYDFTPKNTENMVKNASAHLYDSTLFHRVIPTFMIQGGDPDSKHAKPGQMLGMGGLSYTIPAEISDSAYHKRGAVAVARTNTPDKSGSASQFYIVVGKPCTDAELDKLAAQKHRTYTAKQREIYKTQGGTPHLDGDYTVFGEVLEGMDVVDKIANAPRDRQNRPNSDIRMISVRLLPETLVRKRHGLLSFLRRKKKS